MAGLRRGAFAPRVRATLGSMVRSKANCHFGRADLAPRNESVPPSRLPEEPCRHVSAPSSFHPPSGGADEDLLRDGDKAARNDPGRGRLEDQIRRRAAGRNTDHAGRPPRCCLTTGAIRARPTSRAARITKSKSAHPASPGTSHRTALTVLAEAANSKRAGPATFPAAACARASARQRGQAWSG